MTYRLRAVNAIANGFGPDRLLTRLRQLPAASRYRVGFSGGVDSTALLVAMHELGERLPAPFQAVHFHHGLQQEADDWLRHCETICTLWGIPFRSERLAIAARSDGSTEAAARRARYRAIERLLQPGEVFLTAHNAGDCAETLFLHLMRGSGVEGLASIPPKRRLARGWVARPLLDFTRDELQDYLVRQSVTWIDDPSNFDTSLDRNYLRHDLLPRMEARWPGSSRGLARTARYARQAVDALATLIDAFHPDVLGDRWTMALSRLLDVPPELRPLVLRHWIRNRHLPPPPAERLLTFLSQLEATRSPAAEPELRWGDWLVKRYREWLWLIPLPLPSSCPVREWPPAACLDVGNGFGKFRIVGPQAPEAVAALPERLHIGPRRAGARVRLHPGGPHRPLKDILRESHIPTWFRDAVPVLYRDENVLAVGDWTLAHEWRDWLTERQLRYVWEPGSEVLQKLRSDQRTLTIDSSAGGNRRKPRCERT